MKYLSALICTLCFALAGNANPVDQPSVSPPKTITIDMPDRSVPVLLRDLADLYEINVVIPETLQGRTSVKLRDVTWQQAFNSILRPVNYHYVELNNVIKVVSDEPVSDHAHSTKIDLLNLLASNFPWLIYLVGFGAVCVGVAHLFLFFGMIRDRPPEGARFAPKIIWSLFVLFGGVVPLIGYWIIHHSTLRLSEKPSQ